MKREQKIRDLIYVSNEHHSNCFYSYGIEFHEFMDCVQNRPENLLLLKHNFDNPQWNQHSRFDYVTKQEINELIDDNVYGYGDFCWVDFSKKKDLDELTKDEIAELLFFSHLAEPLHNLPKVRFAYYAHDDGWFNKLYVTHLQDYEILLSQVIILKLFKLTGRKLENFPKEISAILIESTRAGLFIDLSKIVNNSVALKIPITAIGHYTDMDKVYDFREEITDYQVWLVYSTKSWKLFKQE
ncbi:hypothetical protein [Brevibacillus centrosporus]|uniref:hypothetical protein n=1 Tax=Brevibacillus centrosporus TaxID=54910 RepID=UPI003B01D92C